MSRDLVRESFRYANGQMAVRQPITVVYRGTDTLAPVYTALAGLEQASNPLRADSLGTVAFYAETGLYDFLALGARIPFDIEDAGGGSGSDFVYNVPANAPLGTWSILHPLGRIPIVQLYDLTGHPQIQDFVASESSVVVTWPYPVSGRAVMR